MKKVENSAYWYDPSLDLLEGKKEVIRKPRAYKSLHSSEYVTIKTNETASRLPTKEVRATAKEKEGSAREVKSA